jgi:hypothetical protein
VLGRCGSTVSIDGRRSRARWCPHLRLDTTELVALGEPGGAAVEEEVHLVRRARARLLPCGSAVSVSSSRSRAYCWLCLRMDTAELVALGEHGGAVVEEEIHLVIPEEVGRSWSCSTGRRAFWRRAELRVFFPIMRLPTFCLSRIALQCRTSLEMNYQPAQASVPRLIHAEFPKRSCLSSNPCLLCLR